MDSWDKLLSSALLGTERSQPHITLDELDVLQNIPHAEPEHDFLVVASVLAAYRRAGYVPVNGVIPATVPAPDETRPVCSPRSAAHLIRMLRNALYYEMLLEWMDGIARKGKRLPHPYLPALFDVAYQHRKDDRRPAYLLTQIMGERGTWLISREKKWNFLLSLEPEGQPPLLPELPTIDEEQAIAALTSNKPFHETAALHILAGCKYVWSDALTDAFIDRIVKETGDKMFHYLVLSILPLLSYLPVHRLDGIIDRLSRRDTDRTLVQLLEMLQFRCQMLEEIAHE